MDQWFEDADNQTEEAEVETYDITSTPNDFNITTLFNLVDKGLIRMPPFQRNYVWDKNRASKLIESIILGLPIPQLFLYEEGKGVFYVIDGQQRLLSIYFFIKERFPNNKGKEQLRNYLTSNMVMDDGIIYDNELFDKFALKLPSPVESKSNPLNKLTYEHLDDKKQTFDYLRTIRTVIIKGNDQGKNGDAIYEIFNRLNTGGQNLTAQEIRMSLFYSDFYEMLLRVNKNTKWRYLLSQESTDLHFKDIEILLRVFAMLIKHREYRAPMTKFLNTFSQYVKTFEAEKILYFEKLFISFLDSCDSLEERAFCSTNGKFRISFFETIFVSTCRGFYENNKLVEGQITKESFDAINDDENIASMNQDGLASTKSVAARMNPSHHIVLQ